MVFLLLCEVDLVLWLLKLLLLLWYRVLILRLIIFECRICSSMVFGKCLRVGSFGLIYVIVRRRYEYEVYL